ncbi:site-specific integrase [Paenimyroides ceti]
MKFSIKQKKSSEGKISLYIETYKGSYYDEDGKRKHIREFEFLKRYLHENPKTAKQKKENKEALEFADQILTMKKSDFNQGKYGLQNPYKKKKIFLDFFSEKMEEKINSPKNYGNWSATLVHLKRCISPTLTFEEVDEAFVKRVRKYFDTEAKTKSDTLLAENSKYSYFNKFKATLRAAFDEGYTPFNYGTKIKSFEQQESQREYLTHDELQNLAKIDCKYPILKKAFIFSSLVGLRWIDIQTLIWSEVRDLEDGFKLHFQQEKTGGIQYLYISEQARSLLGKRRSPSDRVFVGLKYSAVYNTELLRWGNRAGITKHITFHSARHTNAVLLLENGADIYTVSKRLGHSELRTTQIYAKMVDQKNKEAANLIPTLNINL